MKMKLVVLTLYSARMLKVVARVLLYSVAKVFAVVLVHYYT